MAPEQVRGEAHRLDGRTDIWALGVMLYEMLTHRRPFRGETRDELYDEILHREPKPPRQLDPEIPAELERICLKCLTKSITERYLTAADLAEDLRRAREAPARRRKRFAMGRCGGCRTSADRGRRRGLLPVQPRGAVDPGGPRGRS